LVCQIGGSGEIVLISVNALFAYPLYGLFTEISGWFAWFCENHPAAAAVVLDLSCALL
jgi:hypothetical protein